MRASKNHPHKIPKSPNLIGPEPSPHSTGIIGVDPTKQLLFLTRGEVAGQAPAAMQALELHRLTSTQPPTLSKLSYG
jgi:hypothetical protein